MFLMFILVPPGGSDPQLLAFSEGFLNFVVANFKMLRNYGFI